MRRTAAILLSAAVTAASSPEAFAGPARITQLRTGTPTVLHGPAEVPPTTPAPNPLLDPAAPVPAAATPEAVPPQLAEPIAPGAVMPTLQTDIAPAISAEGAALSAANAAAGAEAVDDEAVTLELPAEEVEALRRRGQQVEPASETTPPETVLLERLASMLAARAGQSLSGAAADDPALREAMSRLFDGLRDPAQLQELMERLVASRAALERQTIQERSARLLAAAPIFMASPSGVGRTDRIGELRQIVGPGLVFDIDRTLGPGGSSPPAQLSWRDMPGRSLRPPFPWRGAAVIAGVIATATAAMAVVGISPEIILLSFGLGIFAAGGAIAGYLAFRKPVLRVADWAKRRLNPVAAVRSIYAWWRAPRERARLAAASQVVRRQGPTAEVSRAVQELASLLESRYLDENDRLAIIQELSWIVNLVNMQPAAMAYALDARAEAMRVLQAAASRRRETGAASPRWVREAVFIIDRYFSMSYGSPYPDMSRIWDAPPEFMDLGALLRLTDLNADPEVSRALSSLSTAGRITLSARAYALLRGGASLDQARGYLLKAASHLRAREDRLRGWKPTIGVEIEILPRSVDPASPQTITPRQLAWQRAAYFLSTQLGLRITLDQLIELSPGPGFDAATNADMIDALRDAGLVPAMEGDHAKLHITMVHLDPPALGVGIENWRWFGRMIAMLEGVLAVEQRRLDEARHHASSMRNEDFKSDAYQENPSGIPAGTRTRRAEFLAGSVSTGSDPAVRDLHAKALRIVDVLLTAYYAAAMESAGDGRTLGGPAREMHRRFWAEDAGAKRRIAAMFREFFEEIYPVLQESGLDELVGQMAPYSGRRDDFTVVRRDRVLVARLDEIVMRHVARIEAEIEAIAEGRAEP